MGATFTVLCLYYVQAVQFLMDYSAPFLTALSPNQQERLEVLQNNAMMIMLGGPRWFCACIMQRDTSLVLLTNRVQLMMACLVSRVLHRDVGGVAQKRLRRALTQDLEGLRRNLWQLKTSRAT